MKPKSKFKQTEIGMIPEDWKIKVIGDLVKINECTINKNYNVADIEYIDTSSVDKGHLVETQKLKLKEAPSRAKRILKDNDILISTVRPNLKHFFFVEKSKNNLVGSTGFIVISSKKINPKFLYYYLTTNKYTDFLSSIADAHTSTYPSFNPNVIENSFCPYPKEDEQKFIANILSDLDSKIELNQQMNKVLEEISRAIFKRWFVDFEFPNEKGNPYKSSGGEMVDSELGEIPKGWKVEKLGDYVETVSGCSYTSAGLNESKNALVTLKSVGVNGFREEGFKEYTGEYNDKHIVKEGDIVVAHTDLTQDRIILGKPVIVRDFGRYKTMIASMDLSIIKPKRILNTSYLFYLLSTDMFHGHAQGYANGTTVIHLSRKAIPEFKYVIPPVHILDDFNSIIKNVFNKLRNNDLQARTLSQIRDSLLPRLMSGKIMVEINAT